MNNKPFAVEFCGISKRYGEATVVDCLELHVPGGTAFALLGPNGSGKSTTVNMAAGLIKPSAGEILINGLSMEKNPIAVKNAIGVVPEEPTLFRMLTIWEHLLLAGPLYGLSLEETKARARELLDFFHLTEDCHKNVNSASFGMKKKLSIAMALLHAPSVLFMDEPFKGLDPVAARSVREIMARLSEKKVTLFITTHLAAHIEEIIDGFAILSKGKILHLAESLKESTKPLNLEEVFFSCITPPPRPELQWIH